MKRVFFIISLLLLSRFTTAHAQIPETLTYQGALTDAGGKALPDGSYNLTFKLYDAATGGAALWTEAQTVEVKSGVFDVILGSKTALNIAFDKQYWLGLAIGTGTELSPRTRLTATAYSMNARSVSDNAVTSAKIAAGQVVKSVNGIKDDVNLTAGNNVTIDKTGNTLKISAQGGTGGGNGWTVAGNDLYSNVSGNIGIGTMNPIRKLHITGNEVTAGVNRAGITLEDLGANQMWTLNAFGNGAFEGVGKFGINQVGIGNRFIIDQGGNVGIGTTTPSFRLDLSNNALGSQVGNFVGWLNMIGASANGDQLRITHNRHTDGAGWTEAEIKIQKRVDVTDQNFISFRGNSNGPTLEFGYGATSHMTLRDNGNIGISFSLPEAKLHIGAASNEAANIRLLGSELSDTHDGILRLRSGGSTVAFDGGDNVGIGIAAPEAKLHIATTSNEAANIRLLGSELSDTQDGVLRLKSGGSVVAFDGEDNIGIGITAPEAKLHIATTSNEAANIRLLGSELSDTHDGVLRLKSGGSVVTFDGEDNVGIGTATPTAKLDVAGTAQVSDGQQTIRLGTRNDSILDIDFTANKRGLSIHGNSPTDKPSLIQAWSFDGANWNNGFKVDYDGTTTTKVLTITGGADLAEPFAMSEEETSEPGSVVIIDEANPGQLKLSEKAYDTRVAGIISGAGGVNPGLTLSQEDQLGKGQNVALSGRVYAKATAANGAIKPGDLLTTSDVPGHAMKANDIELRNGAIIGKAMTALEAGEGLVLVLVCLQ